jgi:hypothetical protein
MKKYFFLLLTSITLCIYPQFIPVEELGGNVRVIQTSLFFLETNSNARIGGLGEIGCVASPLYKDAGLYQNPALLSYGQKSAGIGYNYMPYEIYNTIYFKGVHAYFSPDTLNTFGYNFTYFTLGDVIFTDENGEQPFTEIPNEFYHQLSYSRKINKSLSLGVAFRYIRSSMNIGSQTVNDAGPLNTYSIDLGANYSKLIKIDDQKFLHYSFGGAITNFGPKVTYSKDLPKDFIPTSLKIGMLLNPEFVLDQRIRLNIEVAYQADKLLVPTPPVYSDEGKIIKGKDPNISPFKALFQSFYDAPDGFSEELHEIMHKFGGEVRLNFENKIYIAARMGKFFEHKTKGNRHYTTTGLGIGVFGFTIDYRTVDSESNIFLKRNAITFGIKMNLDGDMLRF